MTGCELVLQFLWDMQWHHVNAITQACKPGTCNWPARSRVSDLIHKKGYDIEARRSADGMAEYRLRSRIPTVKPASAPFQQELISCEKY